MSIREYIGARYVPNFADPIEHNSALGYEPLTVVMHEGASYVSKRSVPAGIAITDTRYWILWADYNAQLEAYRRTVLTFDGRIVDNSDAIAAFNEELANFEQEVRADGFVTTNRIANNAVTSGKIADGAVGTNDIADNAVTSGKIADGAVGTNDIADNAVTSGKIADGAVNTADVHDNAITRAKLSTAVQAELENILPKQQINEVVYREVNYVHKFNFANENIQSIDSDGIYLYVASYVVTGDTNTPLKIRKIDASSYNVIDTYYLPFAGHANSLCVFNNKAYVTGVYLNGAETYKYIGIYDFSSKTGRTMEMDCELWSLIVTSSRYANKLIGITPSGEMAIFQQQTNGNYAYEAIRNIDSANGICQDAIISNDIYYQLMGSRIGTTHASANCIVAYTMAGTTVSTIVLAENETGNNQPYNELEGIAILGNYIYVVSNHGYLYTIPAQSIKSPYQSGLQYFHAGIMNLFGFGHPYKMSEDGHMMESFSLSPNAKYGQLSSIYGVGEICGFRTPMIYDMANNRFFVRYTGPWTLQSDYIISAHAQWVLDSSASSDAYTYKLEEVGLLTNYQGNWVHYDTWADIVAAGYGARNTGPRYLHGVYNGGPHVRFTL